MCTLCSISDENSCLDLTQISDDNTAESEAANPAVTKSTNENAQSDIDEVSPATTPITINHW